MSHDRVAIIDFGSQTTQLIARRIRELKVYCEVFPCNASIHRIQEFAPKAIVLSGGPASVDEANAPKLPDGFLSLGLPTLGICYGIQILTQSLGGQVNRAQHREFGRATMRAAGGSLLLDQLPGQIDVWMSHGDQIARLPEGFRTIASTATCPFAAIENPAKKIWGVQFHPEVTHTAFGKEILGNFLKLSDAKSTFEMASFIEQKIAFIRQQVGSEQVLMALSGGVDSSVAAMLIKRAIGDRLSCIFVDHGLGRKGEREEVEALFGQAFEMNLEVVDASAQFFGALKNVTDPEQKRKIIGRTFIDVFENAAKKMGQVKFLGQGTLYPDVIESVSFHGGPSATIKSHHNVGGLPERLGFSLVEPLRELFKDEVRELGGLLGLPRSLLWRQPFPGPGLAVRILGEVTTERCLMLREADAIVRAEIDAAISDKIKPWQWFAVLLPIHSVGVMGDGRSYGQTIAVRCVDSEDGMTADFSDLPKGLLGRISNRIMNEIRGISRVVYDISSKPPSTIEWE